MKKKSTPEPTLRSHDACGHWLTEDQRFFECAIFQLQELEEVASKICEQWPLPSGQIIPNSAIYPELAAWVKRRDMLSDSVRIFSAMAVEAFLNFYGVIRLGDEWYNNHLERLPVIPKLKQLLNICDSLNLTDSDTLVQLRQTIAERRNDLVHPKSKELLNQIAIDNRPATKIPEFARDAVRDMESFFTEFGVLIPNAKHLTPRRH